MHLETLKQAQVLQEEIKRLDNYLWYEERPSYVGLFKKLLKVSSKTMLGVYELELNGELKNKIRDVIINHKNELEKRLENL